jgi:soluble lytic murein transglycosylase-like protein
MSDLNSSFFTNPNIMAALGALQGFGQAAMPSRLPVPFGATLGMGAGGAMQGAQQAIQNRAGVANLMGANLGNANTALQTNIMRPVFGLPPLTQQDLQTGNILGGTSGDGGGSSAGPSTGAAAGNGSTARGVTTVDQASGGPVPGGGGSYGGGAPNSPYDAANASLRQIMTQRMFGVQPTDFQRLKMYADGLPPGPDKNVAEAAVAHAAGFDPVLKMRAGESASPYNWQTGSYGPSVRNPILSEGATQTSDGQVVMLPGAEAAIGAVAGAKARAQGDYSAVQSSDQYGNPITTTATNLHDQIAGSTAPAASNPYLTVADALGQQHGLPTGLMARVIGIESGGNPNTPNSPAGAVGIAQFMPSTAAGLKVDPTKPVEAMNAAAGYFRQLLDKYQGNVSYAAGAYNWGEPKMDAWLQGPRNIADMPAETQNYIGKVMFGPQFVASVGGHATPTAQSAPPIQPVAVAPLSANASVGAAGANAAPSIGPNSGNSPVALAPPPIPTSLDQFLPAGYQPPSSTEPPPGYVRGPISEAQKEIQKSDADRVEQYSNQAATGQPVYRNIDQLYQILGRGLSTGPVTQKATELASFAKQIGLGELIPKGFDPSDANAYNKLATDLVFANLKQIGGRPLVTEIEGLKQANPSLYMQPEANAEILTNALANQRWMDARSNLARQYFTRYNSLGDFDQRFNSQYPQVDIYNSLADQARKSGWQFPGDNAPSNPMASLPADVQAKAMAIKQEWLSGPRTPERQKQFEQQLEALGIK